MRAILMAAIAGLASTAAQAQVKESINIRQGQQAVLQLSEPFSTATVGDPNVLDALPRSERVIVLQAKQPGLTDVLLFDNNQRVQRQVTVAVQPVNPTVAGDRGLVLTHNKKNLSHYTAYMCNPMSNTAPAEAGNPCGRVKSELEGKDGLTTYQVIESHNVNENTNTNK